MEQIGILAMIDNILIENKFHRLEQVENQLKKQECKQIMRPWRLYKQCGAEVMQYLLIIEVYKDDLINAKSVLLEEQMEIYQLLQKCVHDTVFDKNVSLLLCVKYEENDFEEINQYILRIEEDPYCFKKLVLYYTENEIKLIDKILKQEECSIWSLIQNEFQEYKLLDVKDKRTNFISKLCIKLPFIPISFNNNQELNNIQNKVQKKIKEKNLEDIWNKITLYNSGEYESLKLLVDKDELEDVLEYWYINMEE